MYQILTMPKAYDFLKKASFPTKTSYRLLKIFNACEQELDFYRTRNNEILEKYGVKDKDGNFVYISESVIKIKDGLEKECIDAQNELLNLSLDINVPKLSLDDLESIDIPLDIMSALAPFIEE